MMSVIRFADNTIENLSVRHKVTTIRDLKSLLNDIVPLIKDPRYLYKGRELRNFRLRPREILANWLICSVKNYEVGPDKWTFSTDPTGGDGLIVERSTGIGWRTEHVFIPTLESSQNDSVEDLMIKAVEHKHLKGEAYAEGKQLVIFADVTRGKWFPNQVGQRIKGQHGFDSVWAAGLEQPDGNNYEYWVICFDKLPSQVWKVSIDIEIIEWNVERIQ